MSNLTGKELNKTAFRQLCSADFLKSGAYCNLNDMARQFGKRLGDWTRLKGTQKLFQAFRDEPSYGGAEPIATCVTDRGTFAHPDIAIVFAAWCDPGFALWMARQARNLVVSRQGELALLHRMSARLK